MIVENPIVEYPINRPQRDLDWPVIDDLHMYPDGVIESIRFGLETPEVDSYFGTYGNDGSFVAVRFNNLSDRVFDTFTIHYKSETYTFVNMKLGISMLTELDRTPDSHALVDLNLEEAMGVASFVADVCSEDNAHPDYKLYEPLIESLRQTVSDEGNTYSLTGKEIEFRQDQKTRSPQLRAKLDFLFGDFYYPEAYK